MHGGEGLSIEALVKLIQGLAGVASELNGRLERAHREAVENVDRCKTDLEVASECVFKLENIYVGILNAARYCNRNDHHQVQELQTCIDNYLGQENIHFTFGRAIDDLKKYQQIMKKNSDAFMQWPWKKNDRKRAVADFGVLIGKFDEYDADLKAKGLSLSLQNPTGFGWWVLMKLRDYLSHPEDPRTPEQAFNELVKESAHQEGDKFVKEIKKVVNDLTEAFA
jgi:hypothetical protein